MGPGTIVIKGKPGQVVSLDGQVVGKTTTSAMASPGRHVVTVDGPAGTRTFTVMVASGGTHTVDTDAGAAAATGPGTLILDVPGHYKVTVDGRPIAGRTVKLPLGSHKVQVSDPAQAGRVSMHTINLTTTSPTQTLRVK